MQRFVANDDQYQRFLVLGPAESQPGDHNTHARAQQGTLVGLPNQQRGEVCCPMYDLDWR